MSFIDDTTGRIVDGLENLPVSIGQLDFDDFTDCDDSSEFDEISDLLDLGLL